MKKSTGEQLEIEGSSPSSQPIDPKMQHILYGIRKEILEKIQVKIDGLESKLKTEIGRIDGLFENEFQVDIEQAIEEDDDGQEESSSEDPSVIERNM